jgi:hypothetical protein
MSRPLSAPDEDRINQSSDARNERGAQVADPANSEDPDSGESFEAQMRRVDAHRDLLTTRGGFSKKEADAILYGTDLKVQETGALWLIRELDKLRQEERFPGTAPVRRGKTLSRLDIADLAMTLVEFSTIGDNLFSLVCLLLDLDRHRSALAKKRPEKLDRAACIDGQSLARDNRIGVRELAGIVGVNASTITRWRRDPGYQAICNHWKEMASKPDFRAMLEEIKAGQVQK